jgi:O-antigen/teichoic acid export membrane protein
MATIDAANRPSGVTTTPRPSGPSAARTGLLRALAAPLLIAVMLQNVGNLALHAALGRTLGSDEYGALGTVLSVMVLLAVPLGALQVAASKGAAAHRTSRPLNHASLRTLAGVSIAAGVVVTAIAPLPAYAFHLPSMTDALLLGPFAGVSLALAVSRGRLLGLDPTGGVRAVAATFVISTAVRLLVAFATVPSLGTTGAVLATLIGEVLALAYAAWAVRSVGRRDSREAAALPWMRAGDVGWSGLAIGGLFLFTTIDLFLARHFLNGTDSGAYVAAATIGKTMLALPAAALAAAYPRMVSAGRGQGRVAELRRTAMVVGGLAMLASIVVAAAPSLVLGLLYGDAFATQSDLVRALALIAGASSLASVCTFALLAVGSTMSLLPWVGAFIQLVVISAWHDSAMEIARGSALAMGITVLLGAVALAADIRARDVRAA